MNDDQPTQPLTDAELSLIRDTYAKSQKVVSGIVGDPTGPYAKDCGGNAIRHVGHLLAEVDRLRAALTALGRNEQTVTEQSCGDASIWSCALGDHCVCKKTKHGGRHECACGSWWFRDE